MVGNQKPSKIANTVAQQNEIYNNNERVSQQLPHISNNSWLMYIAFVQKHVL